MKKKDKRLLGWSIGMISVGWISVSLGSYIDFNYFNTNTANELFIGGITMGLLLFLISIYLLFKTRKKRIV